jgi:hypothetical protein
MRPHAPHQRGLEVECGLMCGSYTYNEPEYLKSTPRYARHRRPVSVDAKALLAPACFREK